MSQSTNLPKEPSLSPPFANPLPSAPPQDTHHDNISSNPQTKSNNRQTRINNKRIHQHFIPYSTFRESVKKSGIIIPRVTEAANIALRYHESMVSRPPGFGKTFIINILESLFLKEKALFNRELHFTTDLNTGVKQFENQQVGYETNNDREYAKDVKEILEQWPFTPTEKPLHVLRFDFSGILLFSTDDESIHNSIVQLIMRVAESNNLVERTQLSTFLKSKKNKLKNPRAKYVLCDMLIDYFLTQIEKLNEEYVILIDDADYIMRLTEDYSNRIVTAFFHSILRHSKKYQFLFATCVYPTSIPFVDISQNPDISTAFGFTIKDLMNLEILDEFLETLKKRNACSRLTKRIFQTKSDLLNEMEFLYGGYCFSPLSECTVLNPIAVIDCIERFSFDNYWIEKALPWREDSISNDFLNYFTIFRQTSTILFDEVIAKILKCPDKVNENTRSHYILLLYFGIFTFANNGKKVNPNNQTSLNNYIWKAPNLYIYEYLSELIISFLQSKSSILPNLINESTNELCSLFRDHVNDNALSIYIEREFFDLYVGAVLCSCGFTVNCRFSEPFLKLSAESLNKIFLINIFKFSDPIKIAELTFKERFDEAAELAKFSSKIIVFMVVHFSANKVQVLCCEPNLRNINNSSNKLSAQYESQEFEIHLNQKNHHVNASNITDKAQLNDKQALRKKTTWQNFNSNQFNLNASLIAFLSNNSKTPLKKHNSEPTPGIHLDNSSQSNSVILY